jgi:homoserine kinase
MGLALGLWNTFELRLAREAGTVVVEARGEGEGELSAGPDNMVAQVIAGQIGRLEAGLHIRTENRVPCGSGLGSSSTAVVAGLVFAEALRAWRDGAANPVAEVDRARVLTQAVNLEGHGDNVAPAMLGGLILVMPSPGEPLLLRVPISDFQVVVCVPRFDFPTPAARRVLPPHYSRADTVFNMGRAMFVLEALRSGDDALLGRAMEDRVHEPYRLPLIPGAAKAKAYALEAGATAVALSGAGPGVIAFAREGHEAIGRAMRDGFAQAGLASRAWVLDVLHQGAHFEPLAARASVVAG